MICLNSNFRGGGGYSVIENTHSPMIWLNFNFRGGGILYYRIGVFCRICTKFSTTPAGSCITDSLSHTTYVETNEINQKLHWINLGCPNLIWATKCYCPSTWMGHLLLKLNDIPGLNDYWVLSFCVIHKGRLYYTPPVELSKQTAYCNMKYQNEIFDWKNKDYIQAHVTRGPKQKHQWLAKIDCTCVQGCPQLFRILVCYFLRKGICSGLHLGNFLGGR